MTASKVADYAQVSGSNKELAENTVGFLNHDEESNLNVDSGGIKPHMGIFSSVSMITGFVIGAGIFGSPGYVYSNVGSVFGALAVWVLGGLLCGMGAFCYAELGTMWMQNGGDHVYLKNAFGHYASLSFSWTTATLALPLCGSSIAAVFGDYVAKLIFFDKDLPLDEQPEIPSIYPKLLAMSVIIFAGTVNAISAKLGTFVQNACTSAKLFILYLIAIVGVIYINKEECANFIQPWEGTSTSVLNWSRALLFALFPCGGFQNLNYMTGEVKNPKRTLPLAITISVIVIIKTYLMANIAYFAVLPLSLIGSTNVVAIELGLRVFGLRGLYMICGFVALSALGAVNGTVYSNSRLFAAAAQEGLLFPTTLSKLSNRGVPLYSIIVSCVIPCLLLLPDGGYVILAPLYSFTTWSFYALTVCALLYLRRTMPHASRPFRVFTPVAYLFLAVCIPVVCMQFYDAENVVRGIVINTSAVIFMTVPPAIIYYFKIYKHRDAVKFSR